MVRVEEILHHHHRVVPLLDRLPVEVRGQLGEVLRVVVHGDRDVLLRRGELMADLPVQRVGKRSHVPTLARALTGTAPFSIVRVSFEEQVRAALDELPPHLAAALENVAVVVEDENPEDPDLFGLYHGVPLPRAR